VRDKEAARDFEKVGFCWRWKYFFKLGRRIRVVTLEDDGKKTSSNEKSLYVTPLQLDLPDRDLIDIEAAHFDVTSSMGTCQTGLYRLVSFKKIPGSPLTSVEEALLRIHGLPRGTPLLKPQDFKWIEATGEDCSQYRFGVQDMEEISLTGSFLSGGMPIGGGMSNPEVVKYLVLE
jgi:hypothetical protein